MASVLVVTPPHGYFSLLPPRCRRLSAFRNATRFLASWSDSQGGMGRYLDDLTAPDCRLAAYADRAKILDVVERFRAGARAGLPSIARLVNVECWLRSIPAGAG